MGVIRVSCMRREEKGRRLGFEFGSPCAFSVSFYGILGSALIDQSVPLDRTIRRSCLVQRRTVHALGADGEYIC
jgi:hypothetical protein